MHKLTNILTNILAIIRANVTPWRLLYWLVAVATFRHSAIGFATLEHGNVWLGALAALAVDAGLLLAAEDLRRRHTPWLIAGLVIAAIGSVYSQLLYSVTNASALDVAAGALWLGDWARYGIYARVLALPFLLPLQVVIYAFASRPSTVPVTAAPIQNIPNKTAPIMSDADARLLAVYTRQPRATQQEVANHIGMSRAWVGSRLKVLEKAGAIEHRNGNGVVVIGKR